MCDKCELTAAVIQEWIAKAGHDKCWYYPELFAKIAEIHGVVITQEPNLPRSIFEGGCTRFQDELYERSDGPFDGSE